MCKGNKGETYVEFLQFRRRMTVKALFNNKDKRCFKKKKSTLVDNKLECKS